MPRLSSRHACIMLWHSRADCCHTSHASGVPCTASHLAHSPHFHCRLCLQASRWPRILMRPSWPLHWPTFGRTGGIWSRATSCATASTRPSWKVGVGRGPRGCAGVLQSRCCAAVHSADLPCACACAVCWTGIPTTPMLSQPSCLLFQASLCTHHRQSAAAPLASRPLLKQRRQRRRSSAGGGACWPWQHAFSFLG